MLKEKKERSEKYDSKVSILGSLDDVLKASIPKKGEAKKEAEQK